jgi:hypothetical protein
MARSSDHDHTLDFERDLPTTPADVEALRASRTRAAYSDLRDLERLAPPEGFRERDGLRNPFCDWPPFEL